MTDRPRVMLVIDHLTEQAAGAERTVLWLAHSLPQHGFDVTLVTTRSGSGWPIEQLEAVGVTHYDLRRRGRMDLVPFLRLARHMRGVRFDVVHAHMFGSNVWGTALGRLLGVPVVVAHEHSWPFEGQPVRRALDFAVGRLADVFIAVSQADAALMRSFEHVPADRIRVVPSAWAPAPPAADAPDVRAQLGIPSDAPVIGTVAHLRPVKRLERLVQAFAHVLERVPEAWLLIAGDGSVRGQLEEEARRLGVDGRMRITGMLADVSGAWAAIDVAAMTSEREGTPTAALEAMAAGIPMVAPAVGGIPELFSTGGGVLFDGEDVQALTDELVRLLLDREHRAAVGERGRERAADYTLERQVQRCVAIYDELLARKQAPRLRPAVGLARPLR